MSQTYVDNARELQTIYKLASYRLKCSISHLRESHQRLVLRAFAFAIEKHGEQVRASGEPYYTHPVEAAIILAGLRMDGMSIAAAVLHDIIEDTDVTFAEVQKHFGP